MSATATETQSGWLSDEEGENHWSEDQPLQWTSRFARMGLTQRGIPMSFLSSGVAAVTGAGSGIGQALAQQLAAAGSAVAIADIDETGLAETKRLLGKRHALVTATVLDVADEAGVRAFAEEVSHRHGRATLLINNAGVALEGTFEEISLDDFRWLMNINFWGTVYGVKYFLPMLKREERSHIVNVSSVFGLIAPPGQPAYSASKFAVRGFTECLRCALALPASASAGNT